jgi:HD superfamily phosphohydrolase
VVNRSEIPVILKKYGFNSLTLFKQAHTILEQPLPALCADRVDYTLRDLYQAGFIGLNEIRNFIDELTIQDGCMVVKSETAGNWIKNQFRRLNEDYFKKPEHVYANLQLAGIIKDALAQGLLQKNDLLRDDFQVLRKLNTDTAMEQRLKDMGNLVHFKQFSGKGAAERFKQRSLHPMVMV